MLLSIFYVVIHPNSNIEYPFSLRYRFHSLILCRIELSSSKKRPLLLRETTNAIIQKEYSYFIRGVQRNPLRCTPHQIFLYTVALTSLQSRCNVSV